MPRPFKRKRSKFDEIREQRRKARGEQARQNALAKRRKLHHEQETHHPIASIPGNERSPEVSGGDDTIFYGLLDPDEQAYYANVNTKLTSDDFENHQDRQTFIEAVYRESDGKELKLASSQSCSRHLERIILASTPQQVITLFGKLLEGFSHLSQHRFGSHVLECLFFEAAKYVKPQDEKQQEKGESVSSDLEVLFEQVAEQMKPNIGFLLTDKFGSHVVRNLVLILSGEPLNDPDTQKLLASKKKERPDASVNQQLQQPEKGFRKVPSRFKKILAELTNSAVSTLDGTYLRALATHPTGNPVLQLLLKFELINEDKGRNLGEGSVFHRLFPLESLSEDSEETKLVSGLTYDSTGSHLIEIVVQHAPGKTFKKLYRAIWKPRMAGMAKNDIASYVAVRILQRLGKDDLADVRDVLLPELPTLLQRRRFLVVQTLVDRCVVRGTDLTPVAEAIESESDNDAITLVRRLLYIQPDSETTGTDVSLESLKVDKHGSLLMQSLLQAPTTRTIIYDSLISTLTEHLIIMAKDPFASRALQVALTSSTSTTAAFRKQFVPRFYTHLAELSVHTSGSYFVESLWEGTQGLHFIKERLAAELAEHEAAIRESSYGRSVWRSWSMDLYSSRRGEWAARAKGQQVNRGAVPAQQEQKKSGIELARERFAQRQLKQSQFQSSVRPTTSLKVKR